MFAPELGVAEDPATGIASGPLGCYLVRHKVVPARARRRDDQPAGREDGPAQPHAHRRSASSNGEIASVRVGGESVSSEKGTLEPVNLGDPELTLTMRRANCTKGDRHDRSFIVTALAPLAPWRMTRSTLRSVLRDREGAGDLQGEVRYEQGHVRRRGEPRLGAERRRSFLQPRQERLLRRSAVLPCRSPASWCSSASTATRRCRPSSRTTHQGRSGQAEQQAGYVTFAHDVGAEHAHDAGLHQLQGQRASSTASGFAPFGEVISGMEAVEKHQRGVRARSRTRARSSRRATRTLKKEFPKLDYIKTATIEP